MKPIDVQSLNEKDKETVRAAVLRAMKFLMTEENGDTVSWLFFMCWLEAFYQMVSAGRDDRTNFMHTFADLAEEQWQ